MGALILTWLMRLSLVSEAISPLRPYERETKNKLALKLTALAFLHF